MQQLRTARRTKILLTSVVVGGVGIGFAVAGLASAEDQAASVSCQTVADKLPAVPAQARAEVDRNLALLDPQIAEANRRLATSQGEGGPNFVNNAILGPLADKRRATLDRIAIAIGRHAARPQGLESLAACSLSAGGGTAGGGSAPATTAPAAADPGGGAAAGGDTGGNAAAGAIVCPSVADKLPAVPAQAQDEVNRNLALLGTQINEANSRLASSVGQGGPNFVQNAILGPLADKRASTLERIAIAIGRHAARPTGLDSLAACGLQQ
jgi:hypothetical protein